jgi:hypothetical protein
MNQITWFDSVGFGIAFLNTSERETSLKNFGMLGQYRGLEMKVKKAIITLELVPESLSEDDKKIASELSSWFKEETVLIPWMKGVKEIVVRDC